MVNKVKICVGLLLFFAVTGCQTQQSGGSVAFSRLTGDYWQIWTMRPDGSGTKQVTTSPFDKRYPVWARGGRELLFRTSDNHAFSINLATGEERRILTSLGWVTGLEPSPDGDKLLLVNLGTGIKDRGDLWRTTLEQEDSSILLREAGLQYDPAWSPDGSQIAYISKGKGFQNFELFAVNSDGTDKRRLTRNKTLELLPAFSPDGETIAYVSDITGDYEIWLMDADGSNARQLTDSEGIDTRPCWSADGKKIMFVSNRSGAQQLWVMNNDGSNPKQLTKGAPSMEPAWRKGKPNEQ